ncbi:SCP2 domain-containing protein [Thalassotalea maritima]|uniref:ubiquinone biosynthesis accessory factor UbiJ n=1 Tax=Thalassotalea maritima TaxID=3242416 RepID=UPI003529B6EF
MLSADTPNAVQQLMPKQVLTAVLEQLINKTIDLDDKARKYLEVINHNSLTVLINELGFPITLHVADGHISVIANKLSDDCLIACSLQTLTKLQQASLIPQLIKSGELDIVGDVKIAQQFASITERLNIDWGTLLAGRIGDVPTHQLQKLANVLKQKFSFAKQQIGEDASEFVLHEARLAVSTNEVEQFNQQVAELAQQVDSLISRFQSLRHK